VAGEQAAGVFYASAALVGGFEKVSHLSRDIAENRHDEQMNQWDGYPEAEGVGDE